MPISKYFKGRGREVAQSMKDQYGDKKGEQVFYATAAKNKMRPDDANNDKPPKSKRKSFGQRIAERMD